MTYSAYDEETTPGWSFPEVNRGGVSHGLTQRDQFNDDETGLAEVLVRETIQNSLDAAQNTNQPVRVHFQIHVLSDNDKAGLVQIFSGKEEHFGAAGINIDALIAENPRLLTIEDFNTSGLTGNVHLSPADSVASPELENFRNFWRVHGQSDKGAGKGGRWGLGKLVFSTASGLRSFFGVTIRRDVESSCMMGQAVLGGHELDGKKYQPHGFWHAGSENSLELPLMDRERINEFSDLMGFERKEEIGLSIAVPAPLPDIDENKLLRAAVENYFFPILAGCLVVKVGNVALDSGNFIDMAKTRCNYDDDGLAELNFIQELSQVEKGIRGFQIRQPLSDKDFDDDSIPEGELERLRTKYWAGQLISVRVPVTLKAKTGQDIASYIDLYLKKPLEQAASFAIYARGPITVPGEKRYFKNMPAYGAMLATEPHMVSFLGDCEDPSHRHWSGREKREENWRSSASTLKAIRYSLHRFYKIISDETEEYLDDLLIDILSISDPQKKSRGKKHTPKFPKEPLKPTPKLFRIDDMEGGFRIVPDKGASEQGYPLDLRVRVAYDVLSGDPFKKHKKYDFDLTKKGLTVEAVEATHSAIKPNVLKVILLGPDFRVSVSGFDVNRDLRVDARKLS